MSRDGAKRTARAAYPLVLPTWLVLGVFFLLPLAILFVISFAQRGTYGGPQADREPRGRTSSSGKFLAKYARSLHPIYLQIFWRSIWMAVVTTVLCLAAVATRWPTTSPWSRRRAAGTSCWGWP